jgi:uncharacterized protein
MKIVIDLAHPAHINFFKHAASKLKSRGHEVTLICLERGKLPLIVRKEFPGFMPVILGRHTGTKRSVIFDANLKRFVLLFKYLSARKFDLGLSVGGFNFGSVLRFLNVPNIQFDDDPERGINTILEKLTATELYYPPIADNYSNIYSFNALKEWAYLSPKYFTPDPSVLDEFSIKPGEYIFVREISTGSLNYAKQKSNLIASFSRKIERNIKVLLSLENRKKLGYYPDNWIIVKEPVRDIHSLIYYSKLVISSGDSMAREGSLLGVPSIYCGNRYMKANMIMIKKNLLFHSKPENIEYKINELLRDGSYRKKQFTFRQNLMDEWEDVTDFIIKSVEKHI